MTATAPRLPDAITADPALQRVLSALAPHRALIVGGAVRNGLLGEPVADIDIATDAPPARVVELAAAAGLHSVPTGIDHGTVTVVADGRPFEVTTFRRDIETDGRRAVVAFSDDLSEDARTAGFHHQRALRHRRGRGAGPGRRPARSGGAAPALRGRPRRPHRRGLPAHPAVLPLPRPLWPRRRGRRRRRWPPARAMRAGWRASRASGSAPNCASCWPRPTPWDAVRLMADAGVLAQVLPGADAAGALALATWNSGLCPRTPGYFRTKDMADAAGRVRRRRSGGRAAPVAERGAAAGSHALSRSTATTPAAGYRLGAERCRAMACCCARRRARRCPPTGARGRACGGPAAADAARPT